MALLDRVRSELAYQRVHASRRMMRDEQWGCGDPRYGLAVRDAPEWDAINQAGKEHPEWHHMRHASEGSRVFGDGVVLKDLPGAGKVFDWRASTWTPVNGGKITPLVFVQHIPVVNNTEGIADFIRLRDVLVAQGLMVHCATDREGNVALFTPFDRLCYQARGANSVSCGCENMHASITEGWSEHQFRAAAWVVNQAKDKHGIPASNGELGNGNGAVRVLRRGQVSHQRVSAAAGYNDRTDPGPGYQFSHVRDLVMHWREHHTFEGAPS